MSLLESDAPIAHEDATSQQIPPQDTTLTPVLVEAPMPQTPQQAAAQLLTEHYDWFEEEPPTQPVTQEHQQPVQQPVQQPPQHIPHQPVLEISTPHNLPLPTPIPKAESSPLDEALARLERGDASAIADVAVHAERLSFSKQKRAKVATLIPHLKRIVATSPDSSIVAAAAGALWNVSFEPMTSAEVSSLPGVLIRCMNVHASSTTVVECAIGVLTNLAVVNSNREELLNAGVAEAVVTAVQRHWSCVPVMAQACQLLCLLAGQGRQRLSVLGINGLAVELGNHPSKDIQQWSGILSSILK